MKLFDDKENTITEKNINMYHPEISIALKLADILAQESDSIKLEIGLCSLYLFKCSGSGGLSNSKSFSDGTENPLFGISDKYFQTHINFP